MKSTQFRSFTAFVVAIALYCGSANASNLIVNGDFEGGIYSDTQGGVTNSNVPDGWTPSLGFDFEAFNQAATGLGAYDGNGYLRIGNFDDPGGRDDGKPAILSQTFGDIAGSTYNVAFFASNGGNGGDANAFLTVSVDGVGVTVPGTIVEGYVSYAFSFVGTGSDTLSIWAQTNPSEWFVDDVSVDGDLVAGTTPLPAGFPLFATGLAALGWFARPKKKAA